MVEEGWLVTALETVQRALDEAEQLHEQLDQAADLAISQRDDAHVRVQQLAKMADAIRDLMAPAAQGRYPL